MADADGKMVEVDYTPSEGFVFRVKPRAFQMLPDETMGHLRTANKEMLLAFRSVLDQMIETTDRAAAKAERSSEGRRPRRVTVRDKSDAA